jgi:hypothetical protein
MSKKKIKSQDKAALGVHEEKQGGWTKHTHQEQKRNL